MGDFVKLLEGHLSRRQIRSYVTKLVAQKVFMTSGSGAGTHYSLSDEYKNDSKVLGEALKLGMDEIRRRNVTKNGQYEDVNVGK